MDYDEQGLRDEVIYLHSLWRQGPPRNPNPNPYPYPYPNPRPISKPSIILHQTSISTTFKNTTSNKKRRKIKKFKWPPESNPQPKSPGAEWPVQPIPDPPSGWLKAPSLPATRPATAEEKAKFIALQLQEKGLAACRDFFSRGESDVDDDDDDDEDDVSDDDVEEDGCEEFEFFVGLFAKDAELRSYYEKNNEGGVFCCLVCSGMGKKVGKKFKDCLAIVQHSVSISKTNKRRAHRAYGRVICRILGWDVNRLPMIVLKANSNGNTCNLDPNDANLNAAIMDGLKGDSRDNADNNVNVAVEDTDTNGVKLKDSSDEGNDTNSGDLGKGVSGARDVNTVVLDCTVPIKEDGVEPESKDSQGAMTVSSGANGGTSEVSFQQ